MHDSVIKYLEDNGFDIFIRHSYKNGEPVFHRNDGRFYIGCTYVELTKGDLFSEGNACCSPVDQFSRKTGRHIAIKRALSNVAADLRGKMSQREINNLFSIFKKV